MRIERETLIGAPVARVWAALTEGEHVGRWFGDGSPAKVDLRPGGWIVFDHGGHGPLPARIERVEPGSHLSYRWVVSGLPGEEPDPGNSTLVEFTLVEEGGGTRLRVVESGFDAIPGGAQRYEANARGWGGILDALREYVAA
jgi:uncharacterized protein YndB with AHSA1/START domain